MNPTVAVIAQGAMGAGVGGRLAERGLRVVTSLEGRSAASAKRAAEKGMIKAQMREIRAAAEKAREAHDYETLHRLRRQHHSLNHSLRTSAKRAMLKH